MEANDALTSLVGRSRYQLEKIRVDDLIHEDDRDGVGEALRRVASGGEARRFFQARCMHSDGHEIPVGLALSMIPGSPEDSGRLVLQIQDLTELRRAQEYRREIEAIRARQLEALEINDAVVQGLVVAKYALELGYEEKLMESLDYTLRSAQSIVTGLLQETGQLGFRPGDLARVTPIDAGGADGD
jgi:PAS domain S-box-containing protein